MKLCIKRTFSYNSLKDYYRVMGLNRSASAGDIKKKFIELTKTYHPDVNSNHNEKFKEINEAYTVLSKEGSRQEYDQSANKNRSASTNDSQNPHHSHASSRKNYHHSVE